MTATPDSSDGTQQRTPFDSAIVGTALLGAVAYFVLVGGTAGGEVASPLRLMNGLIGGVAIGLFVLTARGGSDRIDLAMVAAVVAFSIAGVFSTFPRESFDAVVAALAYGAAFYVARRAMRNPDTRRRLVMVFVLLSAALTLLTAARWLTPIIEWWSGTGWTVIPPLNFELVGVPWGHRHDLALLLALLYPAWWIGRPSAVRRACAVVIGVLVMLCVLVDASRAVWLGLAVATATVALPWLLRRWRSSGTVRLAVLGAFAVVAVVAVLTGIGPSIVERATSLGTVDYRAAMFGSLVTDWLTHPVTGNGPGSFPWVLQLTDYFDTNSWAPRHPDSAVVMALAEGGVLGIAALTILVVGLGPAILRSRSVAARWALVAFGVTSLLANPTDFTFLVVVAIAWAGYALPFEVSAPTHPPRSVLRVASAGALVVIGAAFAAMTAGSYAYDTARTHLADPDLDAAVSALDVAVTLDPGMALYVRQRGAVHHMQGDTAAAVRDLEASAVLNPADDLAWRTLAETLRTAGDLPGAGAAITRALELQRSDPTNLLLAARLASAAGEPDATSSTLSEILQAWPQTAFALGWSDTASPAPPTNDLVELALERWLVGAPAPEPAFDQILWLSSMGGRDDLVGQASAESSSSPDLDEAFVTVMQCEDATALFDRMDPGEQRSYGYWWLLVANAERQGGDSSWPAHMAALMGHPLDQDAANVTLNPLNENGSFSADRWGYRRLAIVWPSSTSDLPSAHGGLSRWAYEPAASAASTALLALDACSNLGEPTSWSSARD